MQISHEQFSRLESQRKGKFLERLCEFIAGKAPQRPEPESLDLLYRRAQAYGLSTEQELAGYIVVGWAAGVHEGRDDPVWISEVMRDPYRTPIDKIAALFERADHFPRVSA